MLVKYGCSLFCNKEMIWFKMIVLLFYWMYLILFNLKCINNFVNWMYIILFNNENIYYEEI